MYALALRQIGTDGSRESHWLKNAANFQSGDSLSRRDQLASLNPDPAIWEIADIASAAELESIRELVYASERAAQRTAVQTSNTNFSNARSKLRALFLRAGAVDGLTAAEVDEFFNRIR